MAGVLAAKRGSNSLPRYGRVRAAERTRAIELILRMFALGERVDATAEDAATIERVLGIAPNGRRHRVYDTEPWLTGPAEAIFDAADVVALPKVLQAMETATDTELETARQFVLVLLRCLPLMARMIAALFANENYAGMAGLQHMDQYPELVLLMVPWVVGALRAGWQENLRAIAAALAPVPELIAQTEQILDMPAKTLEANMSGQSLQAQQTIQRIITAAIDGKLKPAGEKA